MRKHIEKCSTQVASSASPSPTPISPFVALGIGVVELKPLCNFPHFYLKTEP